MNERSRLCLRATRRSVRHYVARPPILAMCLDCRSSSARGNRQIHWDAIVHRDHGVAATMDFSVREVPQHVFAIMHSVQKRQIDGSMGPSNIRFGSGRRKKLSLRICYRSTQGFLPTQSLGPKWNFGCTTIVAHFALESEAPDSVPILK